jgi:Ni,Fe-hydrogenase III large subunit
MRNAQINMPTYAKFTRKLLLELEKHENLFFNLFFFSKDAHHFNIMTKQKKNAVNFN